MKIIIIFFIKIYILFTPFFLYAKEFNIILILSDDQSWAGLSVKMDPNNELSKSLYDETPNLEKLAFDGTRFTNAYAPSPVCSPSRISIQTGKSPARLNWTKAELFLTKQDKQYLIPPSHSKNIKLSEITIGEMLKAANYKTAHFGKWHLLGGGPDNHGYDYSDGNIGNKYASNYSDENPVDLYGMIKRAKSFINNSNQEGKPFYIQLSLHALHYPENASKETIYKYKSKYEKQLNRREIARLAINENMDTAIGDLLEFLKINDYEKNTFIIFTSDNGAGSRHSILKGGKGGLWEGGIRIPFIIKGPGIPKNHINRTPIIGYDLFPTFMNIAGLKNNFNNLDGIDIFKTFEKDYVNSLRSTRALFFHFPHYQSDQKPQSAIIQNNWKLIKYYDQQTNILINLENDIFEKNNLIHKEPQKYQDLLSNLNNYLVDVNASFPAINPIYDPNEVLSKKDKKIKKYQN